MTDQERAELIESIIDDLLCLKHVASASTKDKK